MKTGNKSAVDTRMAFKITVVCRYRERKVCRLYKLFTKNMNRKRGKAEPMPTMIVRLLNGLKNNARKFPGTARSSANRTAAVRDNMSPRKNMYLNVG